MKDHYLRIIPALMQALIFLWPVVSSAVSKQAVDLHFVLKGEGVIPFSREIFADVEIPSGEKIRLPAFCVNGTDIWAVRIRKTSKPGEYRLIAISENCSGKMIPLQLPKAIGSGIVDAAEGNPGGIIVCKKDPRLFCHENGKPYYPIGTNVAFQNGEDFNAVFATLHANQLNWSRVWMCHWGGTNLEWLAGDSVKQPVLGVLDLSVADKWDHIVEAAESNGVYFQLVLQHHGQFSTQVNPNWDRNPWNSVNGGFLNRPSDFFRNEKAKTLFRNKLRYSVARWGYSTSIMAWEFFNEVMFTDAVRIENDEAAVVAWHEEMAAYLRSIDPYHHLITTSTDDIQSPINKSVDFLQPHRYAIDMILNVAGFDRLAPNDRPIFYGEAGDDWVTATSHDKEQGFSLDAITWASLAGDSLLPAQQWYHERLISTGRIKAIGCASRFANDAGLDRKSVWTRVHAEVDTPAKENLVVSAAAYWQKRPLRLFEISTDGSVQIDQMHIPHFLVGTAHQAAEGFPDRISFEYDFPKPVDAVIRFSECGKKGAKVDVRVDESEVATISWMALPQSSSESHLPGQNLNIKLPSGRHKLELQNLGEDTVRFHNLEAEVPSPLLRVLGKRTDDTIVLFVWNPHTVFSNGDSRIVGSLRIPDMQKGTWEITWWGPDGVVKESPSIISHRGGMCCLQTVEIARYAAVIIRKEKTSSHP